MKYPLDCEDDFNSSMIFWIARFLRYKLSTLSNKELKDPSSFSYVMYELLQKNDLETLEILSKKARNAGLNGINIYFTPLKKLALMAKDYKFYSLKQLDEDFLSDFLASCTGGLSDATKKNYRIAVISFFKYLDENNEDLGTNDDDEVYASRSHSFKIKLKNWQGLGGKSGEKLPEFLNEDELERFLKALNEVDFKKNTIRNQLIIKIIIYTGIRVSEALNIKQKDISIQGDCFMIRIRGKGNKYRIVMIKQHLINQSLALLLPSSEGYLFYNQNGNRLTQAYVSRIIEQILLSAGIRKEKNGAHMLRHTFATLLYMKKKDIVLVQEALGHASLNTSRIYTHFDSERLQEAASVAEDLAKIKN